MKIAVYTAMFPRSFRQIGPPIYVNNEVDYLFFSQGELSREEFGGDYRVPPFQLRIVERQYKNDRTESRFYKFLSHEHLSEYDWTIYHDCNVRLRTNPVDIVEAVRDTGYNMMLQTHPWRDCMYQELEATRPLKPCRADPTNQRQKDSDAQVAKYKAEGFPKNRGMAACNFIVRNNRDPKVQEFNQFWWDEYIRAKNGRDQCCFEYCTWKVGIKYFRLSRKAYSWAGNEFYIQNYGTEASVQKHITPLQGKGIE